MIEIYVKYIGYLQKVFKKKDETIDLDDNSTIDDLINHLSQKNRIPEEKFSMPLFQGKFQYFATIIINDKKYDELGGIKAKLRNKDTVTFIPPLGGG